MPDIILTHDLPLLQRALGSIRKHIPYSTAVALNDVAFALRARMGEATRTHFDRPTRPTQGAFRVTARASKRHLVAMVAPAPWAVKYLRRQVVGSHGQARIVPKGRAINRYGNLPRGFVDKRRHRPGFFVGKPRGGGLNLSRPSGVYQRLGRRGGQGKLRLLAQFADRVSHRPQLPLARIAKTHVARHFPPAFDRAFARAMRNRR